MEHVENEAGKEEGELLYKKVRLTFSAFFFFFFFRLLIQPYHTQHLDLLHFLIFSLGNYFFLNFRINWFLLFCKLMAKGVLHYNFKRTFYFSAEGKIVQMHNHRWFIQTFKNTAHAQQGLKASHDWILSHV